MNDERYQFALRFLFTISERICHSYADINVFDF